MTTGPAPPEGFVSLRKGRDLLIVAREMAQAARAAGLEAPAGWQRRLDSARGAGRGGSSVAELVPGRPVRLKALCRGGWAARMRRDRFLGTRRLLANLTLPLEARRRGISTPAPVALLVTADGAGFHRGWLAVDEVSGGRDLAARFRSSAPPGREELARVMAQVRRMHDQGLEHRDLNLGNVLLSGPPGSTEAAVIDLDGARWHRGGLGFRARQRGLRRLERSHVKLFGPGPVCDLYYELYAAGDAPLRQRLERGRPWGRLWIRFHRLGWGRRSGASSSSSADSI